ncbi:MAG: hypothetical protein JSS07_09020, partial [Proteobacteria bacterium]|nr:hypothetical protein [Pseudomonadota bacterium]
ISDTAKQIIEYRPKVIEAINSGDRSILFTLQKQGFDFNIVEWDGLNPFYHAIKKNDPLLLQSCFTKSTEINAIVPNVGTPLTFAIKSGSLNLLVNLLKAGAAITDEVKAAAKDKQVNLDDYIMMAKKEVLASYTATTGGEEISDEINRAYQDKNVTLEQFYHLVKLPHDNQAARKKLRFSANESKNEPKVDLEKANTPPSPKKPSF